MPVSKRIEFYYDYGSPASYLAWTRLPELCARRGATLTYRPVLVGGLFKIVGTTSPASTGAKERWFFDDMRRHAMRYGIAYRKNPHFMINTLPIMRAAVWAERQGCLEPFNRAMFLACWADGRDMNDSAVIQAVLVEGGFDADAVGEAIRTNEIKQALIKATEDAAARGVFGVPTMFVGDEMHFGQDRLDWVERALAA